MRLPEFVRVDEPVFYDNSVERTEIIEVPCSKSTLQALNAGNSQFSFVYNGEFLYRLGSCN